MITKPKFNLINMMNKNLQDKVKKKKKGLNEDMIRNKINERLMSNIRNKKKPIPTFAGISKDIN